MTTLLNNRYRIVKALGEGGFGKAFLGEDTHLPSLRPCVIKQLKPVGGASSDQENAAAVLAFVQERFSREAAVLEAVGRSHSQIPDLYAYFLEKGQFYLVQEWVEGQPLSAIAQEVWSENRVRDLLVNTLNVLAHVHREGIIHRDIKPDNIIFRKSDQLPCLIDFGAVKEVMSTVVGPSGSLRSSIVIGTPGFMPPEQAMGQPTFASDIYGLAMTAIYLLTKRSPAELPIDSNHAILWRQFSPSISDRLAGVLTRAAQPFAQIRYATANDMLVALQAPEPGVSPATAPSSTRAPISTPAPISTAATPKSSNPTVIVSPVGPPFVVPVGQTVGQTVSSPPPAAGAPAPNSVEPLKKRFSGWLWMRIALGAGALVLAAAGLSTLWQPSAPWDENAEATLESYQAHLAGLEKTVKGDPKDVDSRIHLAQDYLEVGNFDLALKQVDEIYLVQDPQNASTVATNEILASIDLAQGEYASVIDKLTREIDQGEPGAKTYNLRGDAYYEKGEYDKAITDYRSALTVDPQNGQAYFNWAAVNIVQGNAEAALQNLDLAIENDPTLIHAYSQRGATRSQLGDSVGAEQDWQTAIAMSPQTANDYVNRGLAKWWMGDNEGTVADFDQALTINPNFVDAYIQRASFFSESGETDKALSDLASALDVNPSSVAALYSKAEILGFQTDQDWQVSIDLYSKALAINPNEANILHARCFAYLSIEQLDLGLADCEKGLKINPSSPGLYLARGDIRRTQENYEAAIQDYNRTVEIIDESGGDLATQKLAYSNRASALMGMNNLDGALADINKAIELNGATPEDYFKRGMIYAAKNDKENGAADMRKAADLYTQQNLPDDAQVVMDTMKELGL
jgi:tetratricopeptide (TPR) repeat protein